MAIIAVLIELQEGARMPEGVRIRARMGPRIVTANIEEDDLECIRKEPGVVRIELNSPIGGIRKT